MLHKLGMMVIAHRDYQMDVAMDMGRKAAESLRARGWDVHFSPDCIVDPARARETAIAMAGMDLCGVIYFLGTWIECPVAVAAIRELEHLPFALWAFPQFINEQGSKLVRPGAKDSTGSLVALSVLSGALKRMDYRFPRIIGFGDDATAVDAAERFCRTASTVLALKRSRLGMVGYMSMGMYPGTFDHVLVRRHLGPEVVPFDTYTLIHRMQTADAAAVAAELDTLEKTRTIYDDARPCLDDVARMTVALQSLVDDYHLDGLNVKCQYELSQEYGCIACVPISTLADRGVVTGCEGDIPVSLSMLALHYLTGEVVTYGDVLDWDDGTVLMSACGFLPFSMAHGDVVIRELGYRGFKGPLVSAVMRPGKVTLFRFNEGRGDFHANIVVGQGIETQHRMGRFPALNVRVNCDRETFFDAIASQHYALCYGDAGDSLETLCDYLGVSVTRLD